MRYTKDMVNRGQILQVLNTVYPSSKRDPQVLNAVIERAELFHCEPGQVIFEERSEAESFFLVIAGRVGLAKYDQNGERLVTLLNAGDFFGYEMLEYESEYNSKAVAEVPTDLLIFNRDQLAQLADEVPNLRQALTLMYNSYKLAGRTLLDWVSPDETVYYIARRHPFYLISRLLGPLAVALVLTPVLLYLILVTKLVLGWIIFGAAAGFLALWVLWLVVDWGNDYAVVTNQRVVFLERVIFLYDSRQEAPLNAVLSVTTDTDFWGRSFSFGAVTVSTYAGTIKLKMLSQPEQVAAVINAILFRSGQSRVMAERQLMASMIRKRIGLGEPKMPDEVLVKRPVQRQVRSGPLNRALENMFQMRTERGKVITYRKHWFLLMRSLFFPGLLFLVSLAGVIAIFSGLLSILPGALAFIAVGILGILMGFLWLLYQYYDWHNDYYEITDDQILDVYKKPLGQEERRVAPIKNIQSVRFDRKLLFGLIFNYGTVYIQVGDTLLTFDNVFNPSDVQRELLRRIAAKDMQEKQQQFAGQREMMADFLQIYYEVMQEQPPHPETSPEPGQ